MGLFARKFQITEYTVTSEFFKGNERPVTAVLVADLHNQVYGRGNAGLLCAVDMLEPDFILCAGDMLVGKPKATMEPAIHFMSELARRYPVYYGNGNHEDRLRRNPMVYGDMYQEYESRLKRAGVHFLINDKAVVPAGRTYVNIYGYSLEASYYRKCCCLELTSRQLTHALGEADKRCFNILIAHNPVYGEAYSKWGADLTVSGHLHGGIVRLPKLGGVISPQFRLFPKYDGGDYLIGGRHMIVSRGLGSHTVNIRIMNRPELIVVKLLPPRQP